MNARMLMSLGSTLAATKLVRAVSRVEANDVLQYVGLARRRSHMLDNLALLGMGALAGAGAGFGESDGAVGLSDRPDTGHGHRGAPPESASLVRTSGPVARDPVDRSVRQRAKASSVILARSA